MSIKTKIIKKSAFNYMKTYAVIFKAVRKKTFVNAEFLQSVPDMQKILKEKKLSILQKNKINVLFLIGYAHK